MASNPANIVIAIIALVSAAIYSGRTQWMLQKVNEMISRKSGCNPLPPVGNVSLHYFAGRGRAESIRMLMEDAEIPYTERRYTKETWPEAKRLGIDIGLYTFGQVPAVMTSKGNQLVQSQAILHFLARSVGYDCDCEDLYRCEMITLGVEDIYKRFSKMIYDPEFSMIMRNDYVTNTLPTWIQYFENLTPARAGDTSDVHFSSDRVTWIDFLVYDMLEVNINFLEITKTSDDEDINFLEKFPKLKDFYETFGKRPKLLTYFSSDRRLPYKIPHDPK